MSASTVHHLSRQWTESLAGYRRHRNDEHLEALVEETLKYAGLHLENDLIQSPYWSKAPLSRRVAVLLFLVDRGVVERRASKGRRFFAPLDHAETWIASQPALSPYTGPTLELVAALRNDVARRNHPASR